MTLKGRCMHVWHTRAAGNLPQGRTDQNAYNKHAYNYLDYLWDFLRKHREELPLIREI